MINEIKNIFAKITGKKTRWAVRFYMTDADRLFEIDTTQKPISGIDACDITDCDASFVADPFLVANDDRYYCFFEIKDQTKDRGVIGVASSHDGIDFTYEKVVLDEPFHLSYPAVYKVDGDYYMIPESGENGDVRLYEAVTFPHTWRYKKRLLEGKPWADPTLFYHEGLWYLFVSEETHDKLHIFYSSSFGGPYRSHAQNPIYTHNSSYARPAGHIRRYQGEIYRFAQECGRRYGERVYRLKITTLTPEIFEETVIETLLAPHPGFHWNARKIHQFDAIPLQDRWLVATDGEGYQR